MRIPSETETPQDWEKQCLLRGNLFVTSIREWGLKKKTKVVRDAYASKGGGWVNKQPVQASTHKKIMHTFIRFL